jgi:hypothetical protein
MIKHEFEDVPQPLPTDAEIVGLPACEADITVLLDWRAVEHLHQDAKGKWVSSYPPRYILFPVSGGGSYV